jgi:hypothetical protein
MSVGEESLTNFFPGPLITGKPEQGFQNLPLNNNVGIYTVYKVFDSLIDPINNYKMYVVRLDISNLPPNQSSPNNPLPTPYCALSRMAFPSVLFTNPPSNTTALTVSLASNGQSFSIRNDGTAPIVASIGSFYIIGY